TRGSVDLGAQYVDGDGGFAEVPLTFAGAAGQRFLVRSPRTQGEAALLSLAGRHDLGGGWSLGGHARAVLGRAEQEFGGGMTLAWRF
ncbi:MAG: hypothetical protein AB7O91_07985, partial [Sphingomonas sp.]